MPAPPTPTPELETSRSVKTRSYTQASCPEASRVRMLGEPSLSTTSACDRPWRSSFCTRPRVNAFASAFTPSASAASAPAAHASAATTTPAMRRMGHLLAVVSATAAEARGPL